MEGLFGFDFIGPKLYPSLQASYWRGIAEALRQMGCTVILASMQNKLNTKGVSACSSIETRAKQLVHIPVKSPKVNFIAHSMGGLDCRYLISKLETPFRVSSLTTVGCPHRGSSFADWLHEKTPQASLTSLLSQISVDISGIQNLTCSFLAEFNKIVQNSSSVAYYSFAANLKGPPPAILRLPYSIVKEREGDNDGVVSVDSAKWGSFVKVLEASHFDLVNAWSPLKKGSFDAISFYKQWANSLYEEGH